jgi:hypothetical protein
MTELTIATTCLVFQLLARHFRDVAIGAIK